jgi:hypothetical protein
LPLPKMLPQLEENFVFEPVWRTVMG